MQSARKLIQIIRYALLGAVLLYLFLILRVPSTAKPNLMLWRAFGFLAIIDVILVFVIRRILVFPAEATLQNQPSDAKALVRWKMGYLITYTLSLSIALYGLALHFFGIPLRQVLPLLLGSFALLVFLGPTQLASDESSSTPIVPR